MKKPVLDNEEKNILASYEKGEWKSAGDVEQEIQRLSAHARKTLQKDQRINIRMSSKDLDQIKVIAAQEGIPYQTLISSIIHKYVAGLLKDKRSA